MKTTLTWTFRAIVALSFIAALYLSPANAQEKAGENSPAPPPGIDLLKLNGSKPNLKADGEGLTSYKISDLFQRGVTTVKPYELKPDAKLPTGYTLFNNLAYVVESDAVFSGENLVAFHIPSATNAESFNQLRILCAIRDPAQPDEPSWIDITVTSAASGPNFATRTLTGLTQHDVRYLLIAVRDEKLARDNFTVDLKLKETVNAASVMEGRQVKYVFEITNQGPETATDISFASQLDPEPLSVNQSQGTCSFEAQNVVCNLGDLKNGETATVTYQGRCQLRFVASRGEKMSATAWIGAAEKDSNPKNNSIHVVTPVKGRR